MTSLLWFAAGVATVVFLLVLVGQLGAVLLEKEPSSKWGHRFTVIGIATTRAVKLLATKNAFFRAVQESLPDIPAGVDANVRVKEGATLTVRAEEPGAVAIRKVTPPRIPPLPLLCLMLVALAGCTPAQRIQAANDHRATGHTTAHVLGADAPKVRSLAAICDYEALEGKPDEMERSIDLDNRGCPAALHAQTAFSEAHAAEVHAIQAAKRGECLTTTPRSAPACDPEGMAVHTLEAGFALANATAEVVAAVKGATK